MAEPNIKQTIKHLMDVRKDHRDIWRKKLAFGELTQASIRQQYEAINKAIRILEDIDSHMGIQTDIFSQSNNPTHDRR